MKLRNKQTGETITLKNDRELALLKFVESSLPNGLRLWEEVKEPLIEDEKIRKAVRAWAEACCIELIEITHSRKCILRAMDAITNNDEICINREIGQILDEKVYNITELCGEEEE